MATIYRCDRCGIEVELRGEIVNISIPSLDYYQNRFADGNNTSYDLCVSCIRQLREFLKNLPKVGKE